MKNEQNKQHELFDEQLYNDINEADVVFPLFFKNRDNTMFTRYEDVERFERLYVNKENESLRASIMYGFNEEIKRVDGDLRLWFYSVFRCQTKIEQEEYEEIFEKIIKHREQFFSSTNEHKYIRQELSEKQKNVKHKWRAPEY